MNLSPIVEAFAVSLSIQRMAAGGYGTHGRFAPGTTSTVTLRGIVHPSTSRDLLVLPEGMRTEESIAITTDQELHTADPGGMPADRVTINGKTYEVQRVEDWSAQGFWRSIAVKVAS